MNFFFDKIGYIRFVLGFSKTKNENFDLSFKFIFQENLKKHFEIKEEPFHTWTGMHPGCCTMISRIHVSQTTSDGAGGENRQLHRVPLFNPLTPVFLFIDSL